MTSALFRVYRFNVSFSQDQCLFLLYCLCLGDVEQGNMTNNSHAEPLPPREKSAEKEDDKEEVKVSHGKDKSVLQAKLTKLSIQIGYAGKLIWFWLNLSGLITNLMIYFSYSSHLLFFLL